MKDLGLIHVYTGDGKGKTTAALGLCMRALGAGMAVYYASFHKNPEKYGYTEMNALQTLGATVRNFAMHHPMCEQSIPHMQICREVELALQEIANDITNSHYDIVVLDEIIISVRDSYITEEQLRNFCLHKPEKSELILTGRFASEGILAIADYVSNIHCIKHPYNTQGITSRKGIEF